MLWDYLLIPYRPLERKLNIIQCLKGEAEWREERVNCPRLPFFRSFEGNPRIEDFTLILGAGFERKPKSQTEPLGKDNSHTMRSTSNACTMLWMSPEAIKNASLNVNYLKYSFKPKRVYVQLIEVRRRNTRTQGRKKNLQNPILATSKEPQ